MKSGRRFSAGAWWGLIWIAMVGAVAATAQGISTTTVQGTAYLANGTPGSGTLMLSWPAFTTANGQAVVAGSLNAAIGADGSVSVTLAPNVGATPAGLFYTAVYQMSDGTTSAEDCRNAARTLVQAACSVWALWNGSYKTTSASLASDVWPGDALQLNAPSANLNAQVVVRAVKLSYLASNPDLVGYGIAFSNDWATDLAVKTGATVPADAWLPAQVNATPQANLNALTVTSIAGSTVTCDGTLGRRVRDPEARLRVPGWRGQRSGDARIATFDDLHTRFGERSVLHKDVRWRDAAELLGVFGSADLQPAAWVISEESGWSPGNANDG